MMMLSNSLYSKAIFYELLKYYLLVFPLIIKLLFFDYLSFSFVLKLFDILEMSFTIDMTIQKIYKSGFEYRRVILFDNCIANFISQLQTPFTNFNTKNREDQILQLFVSPQLPEINLYLCSYQLPFQQL
jgi:hypothetical protein